MFTPFMEQYLRQTWQETACVFTEDQLLIDRLWEDLRAAYSGKSRHYHGLAHIENMLRLAQQHVQEIGEPPLFRFAVFYHDAVYNAARSDNEEKSAQLAEKRLQALGVPAAQTRLVADLILATKTHQAQSLPDANLLLDIDLAILGAPWPAYVQYSQQIRKEYHLYPDFLYKPGRRKVLTHFLQKEHIYQTPHFRNTLEPIARQNLAQELQLLD